MLAHGLPKRVDILAGMSTLFVIKKRSFVEDHRMNGQGTSKAFKNSFKNFSDSTTRQNRFLTIFRHEDDCESPLC